MVEDEWDITDESKKGHLYYRRMFFKNMLELYGATPEDVQLKWKYAGGNRKSNGRLSTFYRCAGRDSQLPPEKRYCVCTHYIKENCYITDDFKLLEHYVVIDNCCINKFIDKNRQHSTCGDPHRNRIGNRCNKCRKSGECGAACPGFKFCRKCYMERKKYTHCGRRRDGNGFSTGSRT